METLHATCIVLDGVGALLTGPSGAGKSDLALRLLEHGAHLVADDRVVLRREGADVIASAPPSLAGLLEIRGYGVVSVPAKSEAVIRRVIDLKSKPVRKGDSVERYPNPDRIDLLGQSVVRAELNPFCAFAIPRLRAILRYDRDVSNDEIIFLEEAGA